MPVCVLLGAGQIVTQLKTAFEEAPFTSKTERLILVVFGHDLISK